MKLTFLLAILSSIVIHAETLQHRRGFKYENASIKEVQANRVKLSHDSGMGWINFEDLDPVSMNWVKNQPEYQKFREESDREQAAAKQQAIKDAEARAIQEAKNIEENERKKKLMIKINQEKTDAIINEYQVLASKPDLWTSNFRQLEKLLRIDDVFIGKYLFSDTPDILSSSEYFTKYFGKPDGERVYTVQTKVTIHDNLDGPVFSVTEYTYNNKITNPTTGKKEDLVLEFYNNFYRRSIARPSGNTSR